MFDQSHMPRPEIIDDDAGRVTVLHGAHHQHSISWPYDPDDRKSLRDAHIKAKLWCDGWAAREAAQ